MLGFLESNFELNNNYNINNKSIEEKLNKLELKETIATSVKNFHLTITSMIVFLLLQELLNLIEKGTFVTDLNHMYNSQTGRYNSVVLSKALQLVDAHLFTYIPLFLLILNNLINI